MEGRKQPVRQHGFPVPGLWPQLQDVQDALDARLQAMSIQVPDPSLAQGLDYIRSDAGAGVCCVVGFFACLFGFNLLFSYISVKRKKYYYTAGGHNIQRSQAEARRIWSTIPPQIRAQGHRHLSAFHANKDWSHIISHRNGGSDSADNGIFEYRRLNRRRGGRNMTATERVMAQAVLIVLAGRTTLAAMTKVAVLGVAAATGVNAFLAMQDLPLPQLAEHGPDLLLEALRQEGVPSFAIAFLGTGCIMLLPSLVDLLRQLFRVLRRILKVALLAAAAGAGLAMLLAAQDLPLPQLAGNGPVSLPETLWREGIPSIAIAFLGMGCIMLLLNLVGFLRRLFRALQRNA